MWWWKKETDKKGINMKKTKMLNMKNSTRGRPQKNPLNSVVEGLTEAPLLITKVET